MEAASEHLVTAYATNEVLTRASRINDNVVELLIMCSACKGGSAKSITGTIPNAIANDLLTSIAVMPYFPYCRQSKKKSHRGAITARMLANLLSVAGVNHVITIDLHASQMQGFFKCPVDNLVAEPLIARWIKTNIRDWNEAVVVSKNPGGTKRVTSMADAMKLSFGIVTTDRRRAPAGYMSNSGMGSMMFEKFVDGLVQEDRIFKDEDEVLRNGDGFSTPVETPDKLSSDNSTPNGAATPNAEPQWHRTDSSSTAMRVPLEGFEPLPLTTSASDGPPPIDTDEEVIASDLRRSRTEPAEIAELEEEFNDEVCVSDPFFTKHTDTQ